jgi:SAM-dependent methyltransferase
MPDGSLRADQEWKGNAMTIRSGDGSAGDADYGRIGAPYARFRQPDPRIARQIAAALGEARTVVNIGAGAGSYEPTDRVVTAVEPSAAMRAQRPAHLSAAIDACAEALPFADKAFDGAMSTISVHQWRDLAAGLSEMRRVTRGSVVILTCDPDAMASFWLTDYCPEITAVEASRFPPIDRIVRLLGGRADVRPVPVPLDCTDRFNEAYCGRPEGLLDPEARLSCSSWSFVSPEVTARFVATLGRDLADGSWDRRHGAWRTRPELDGPLRLIVS